MTISKPGVVSHVNTNGQFTVQCDGAGYSVWSYVYAGRVPRVHEPVEVIFAPSGGVVRVRPA